MALQYPISYLVLSIACFGSSTVAFSRYRYLPLAALGIWVGVSFVVLAIAYLLNSPGILGKRATGGRNPIFWLIIWPYLLLCQLSHLFSRSKSPYSEVAPNLYMGRHLGEEEAEAMVQATGVRTVIDLAAEHSEATIFRQANYLSLPVLDAMPATPDQLRLAVQVIRDGLEKGPVFVHCALGFGRSGAVCAAYLIACGQAIDVKNAIAQLKRVRPGVVLNRSQRDAVASVKKVESERMKAGR